MNTISVYYSEVMTMVGNKFHYELEYGGKDYCRIYSVKYLGKNKVKSFEFFFGKYCANSHWRTSVNSPFASSNLTLNTSVLYLLTLIALQ